MNGRTTKNIRSIDAGMVNENYEPTDPEDDVIDVLREEWRANPYLIRERTDYGKGTINTALNNLTSAGWVKKVTRGLYEYVDDPRQTDTTEPNRPVEFDVEATQSEEQEESDPMQQRAEAKLAEMAVPGRPKEVERIRREAIAYAWERLREEGSMKPRELANDVFGQYFDEPNLGYSTSSGRYAGYQMWDNCVRNALKELPGVHQSGRTWVFREEEQ